MAQWCPRTYLCTVWFSLTSSVFPWAAHPPSSIPGLDNLPFIYLLFNLWVIKINVGKTSICHVRWFLSITTKDAQSVQTTEKIHNQLMLSIYCRKDTLLVLSSVWGRDHDCPMKETNSYYLENLCNFMQLVSGWDLANIHKPKHFFLTRSRVGVRETQAIYFFIPLQPEAAL